MKLDESIIYFNFFQPKINSYHTLLYLNLKYNIQNISKNNEKMFCIFIQN